MIDSNIKSDSCLTDCTNMLISMKMGIKTSVIKKTDKLGGLVVFPLSGYDESFHDTDVKKSSLNSENVTAPMVKSVPEFFEEKLLEPVTFPNRVSDDDQTNNEDPLAVYISPQMSDISHIKQINLENDKQTLVNENIVILPESRNILRNLPEDSEDSVKVDNIKTEYIGNKKDKNYCNNDEINIDSPADCSYSAEERRPAKRGRGRPRVLLRKTHPCSICQKVFSRKTHLTTHQRIHSDEKPFRCSLCFKQFRDNSVLIKHTRVHTQDKPYSCSVCRKAFTQKGNMDRHYKQHTNEKPFVCSVCANGFTTKSHLERHFRIHLDEKPFTCELCEKSFRQKSHLMRHVLIHSREKPYACNLCEKRFRQEQHVSRHKITHIKGLITNILSKQFVSNSIVSIAT